MQSKRLFIGKAGWCHKHKLCAYSCLSSFSTGACALCSGGQIVQLGIFTRSNYSTAYPIEAHTILMVLMERVESSCCSKKERWKQQALTLADYCHCHAFDTRIDQSFTYYGDHKGLNVCIMKP